MSLASNQGGPVGEAPPFASIAAKPDFDTGKLAFFLLDPHPKMTNMQLSRTDAVDLAAYIARLKQVYGIRLCAPHLQPGLPRPAVVVYVVCPTVGWGGSHGPNGGPSQYRALPKAGNACGGSKQN